MPDIKNELREFIIENYLSGAAKEPLEDDDSFLEKGIIDSIGVIELVNFIQDRYDIKIKVPEIQPETIDTLNNLENFIKRKRSERPG
jgi:acyl carrier protein